MPEVQFVEEKGTPLGYEFEQSFDSKSEEKTELSRRIWRAVILE
ncbi:MAG TPA: hypothetical protein VJN71_00445 [Nitrososphaerales archaeon]|nr:hypothetical protein [Nitrososphaerales archaeon]